MNYGNLLLDILNDRFSDMGIVSSISTNSTFNTYHEELDISLILHRPLQYLNLRETLMKDAVDEWLVDLIGDGKGVLRCPVCDVKSLLSTSEMIRHRYCSYCGSTLAFSPEDIEAINSKRD